MFFFFFLSIRARFLSVGLLEAKFVHFETACMLSDVQFSSENCSFSEAQARSKRAEVGMWEGRAHACHSHSAASALAAHGNIELA